MKKKNNNKALVVIKKIADVSSHHTDMKHLAFYVHTIPEWISHCKIAPYGTIFRPYLIQ